MLKNGWKTKLGIITTILTIFGAACFAEDRWNQTSKVEAAESQIKQVEHQTIKSLEQFRKHQDIKFELQRQYWIDDMIMKNRMEQRRIPDDKELKEEGHELKEEKKKIKDRIEDLMRQ